MTNILGIDQALTRTGLAYKNMLSAFCVESIAPKDRRGPERLHFIQGQIRLVCNAQSIEMIVMEGYNYGVVHNPKTRGRAFDLGELGGMIRLYAYQNNMKCLVVPPATLKQFVTGSGAADKERMLQVARERWLQSLKNDDEADALGLWHFGHTLTSGRVRAHQREILEGAEYAFIS